jgi:hypothetical protein
MNIRSCTVGFVFALRSKRAFLPSRGSRRSFLRDFGFCLSYHPVGREDMACTTKYLGR